MVLLINFVELASPVIRRNLAEAANTRKERVRLLLWVLENLGKDLEEEWAAYEREMEEAPEAVRLAHANVLRAWVDLGNLEYGPPFGDKYS